MWGLVVLVEGKLRMVNRALLPQTGSDHLGSFATDDGTLSQNNLDKQEPGSNPTHNILQG